MKFTYSRRFRRNTSRSGKAGIFKKANQQQQPFIDTSLHETYFQPVKQVAQRKCEACEKEDKKMHHQQDKKEETVQKKDAHTTSTGSRNMTNYISSLSGKGQPLPVNTN